MEEHDTLAQWMVRATGFELLGMAFLLPTRTLADALASGEYADACIEVVRGLADCARMAQTVADELAGYAGADAEELFHRLRAEHTRLFIGERKCLVTPYIGVWDAEKRGKQPLLFVSKQSVEIEHFMRRCGVRKNLEAGQTNDPLDHIGTVCEFCMFLCLANAQAVKPAEGAEVNPEDFDAFVAQYLRPYGAWLAGELAQRSQEPLFRAAGSMLTLLCQ